MKQLISLTAFLLLISMGLKAQSKKELEATVATLTAKSDSLLKLHTADRSLLDSLHRLTGVNVHDLDTVRTVLGSRKAMHNACTDSLAKTSHHAHMLQHAVDSLLEQTMMQQGEVDSLKAAIATHSAHSTTAPHPTSGTQPAVSGTGSTAELLRLNGMYEQGLITKEEFLKLKKDIVK